MADTQTAPAGDARPASKGASSIADALDLVDTNPAILGDFLDIDLDDQDTGEDAPVTEDQDDSQSEGDLEEEDLEAEEDDQGEGQSDEESEADQNLELFTIGEDGKRKKVDLDEILADLDIPVEIDGEDQLLAFDELKKGYLRQADYTRKTQEVSERVAQTVQAERDKMSADFTERMGHVDDLLAVFGTTFDREPSFDQLKAQYGDEAKAYQAKEQWRSFAGKIAKAKELAAKRDQEAQEAENRRLTDRVKLTIDTLRETVPEWKDQAKFDAETGAMRKFMIGNGLDDSDIMGILQKPAYVLLVRDAMYGQSLRKKKPGVTSRRRAAPKTVNKRAGSLDKPNSADKRRAHLRKRVRSGTGTKADAIALIEAGLDD